MSELTIERLEAIRQKLLNEQLTVESLQVELLELIEALLEKACRFRRKPVTYSELSAIVPK